MSGALIEELDFNPTHFLGSSPGESSNPLILAEIIKRFVESVALDAIVVLGDTNTALAAALVAATSSIPLAHIEAGCRSFDRSMPEEINRTIIADCADLNFAPTRKSFENLYREAVPGEIVLSGHPIVDLVRELAPKIKPTSGLKDYAVLTLHRPENVDTERKLSMILDTLGGLDMRFIFPVHPRTRKNMQNFGIEGKVPSNIETTNPVGYLDMLKLVKGAKFVATDSGGMQQEAFLLHTPCLTIRRTFEWVETFEAGVNFLANPDREGFGEAAQSMVLTCQHIKARFKNLDKIFGDGHASDRIVRKLSRWNPKR